MKHISEVFKYSEAHKQLSKRQEENEIKKGKQKQVLIWYDLFVDYISNQDKNLYNEACEYADKNE